MFQKDFQLTDFISLEDWQSIQDSISEALEVTLKTFSPEGKLLSRTSYPTRLCDEIFPKASKKNPGLSARCFLESRTKNLRGVKEEVKVECPFDLNMFVVPVKAVGNTIAAYLILGPIMLKSRKDISQYAEEAEKFGIKLEELVDALIEINVFSYNKIHAIIHLIKDIFSHMAQTGYHKRRLGEITPEVRELDPLFSRYYEEKILNALLNSCTLALDADSGSVMTLDKRTDMLHIKAASKLDDDVINNTNIKLGEGIAGVAAATAEPIVLPKDKDKNGLAKKMKRKYIKSSMIVPFNKENTDDVYGVINLNILRKNIEFSKRDIALVKELVNMASIALVPLKTPDTDSDTAE